MLKGNTMKNTVWTTIEEHALISMRKAGLNDEEISKVLNKTASAVGQRRSKLAREKGLDGMVKWKCKDTTTYQIDKPSAEFYEVNTPVTEMDDPTLDLTQEDELLLDIRCIFIEELLTTNDLIREEVRYLADRLDYLEKETVRTNKTTLGALLVVASVLALEILWPILN